MDLRILSRLKAEKVFRVEISKTMMELRLTQIMEGMDSIPKLLEEVREFSKIMINRIHIQIQFNQFLKFFLHLVFATKITKTRNKKAIRIKVLNQNLMKNPKNLAWMTKNKL